MPQPKKKPAYGLHKPSGQARVRIDGKDHYLGPYNSPESLDRYDELIRQWTLKQDVDTVRLTVDELALRYVEFADGYYQKNGRPTGEADKIRIALRHLLAECGRTRVRDFGPKLLKATRERMIDAGVARRSINIHVGRIRRMVKWGVAEELVPPDILTALQSVPGLQRGRTEARETEPVGPVPIERVEAIRPYVSRQVWAMIQLQLLTGARPGEVLIMRACDLDMSGDVWVYTPDSHKTEHHGHARRIFIGPRAQEVIRPFLGTNLRAYLFSPRAAVEEYVDEHYRDGATIRKTGRVPGEHYTVHTYHGAVRKGCEKAFVMPAELRNISRKLPEAERAKLKAQAAEWRRANCWHPHQLRHTAATAIRREFGVQVAQVILGHATLSATEVYAEVDTEAARKVAGRVG